MPHQAAGVPACFAAASSAAPLCRPKFMPADAMPENSATSMPFLKSNSATAAFFCSSESSPSLNLPARPTNAMPSSEPITPPSTIFAPVVATSAPALPVTIGGIRVPVAEQSPQPIASPRPMPR